jgi:predicted SnoaL-like aldol condensation-catalyzing enzyme
MNTISNKELVRQCYKKIFVDYDSQWILDHVAEDYIQHSPHLPTGRTGLLQVIEHLKQAPKTNAERPTFLIIGEENYVASLWHAFVAGSRKVIVDLFRIERGKLAEHWDATQESDQEQMIIQQHQFAGEAIKMAATTFVKERDQFATIARTINDENVVLVQATTTHENSTFVVYTIIVFNNNTVADFREIKQRIPDAMPHQNGMI